RLGDLFLRNAAREFRDPGMLKVANFYKCYRAFVRGKVESIQALPEEAADREEHATRAKRYFHLALRYATSGSDPLILAVMGRIGTGKSTVAKQLASELDWPVFSSDVIRKTLAGVPLTARTASDSRAEIYSEDTSKQTYNKLLEQGLAALVMHSGVVLDATFSSRAKRDLLRAECAKAHVPLQVIELVSDTAVIAKRLKAREGSATEVSDARLEDLEKLSGAYERPSELAPDLIEVATSGAVSDTVQAVLLRFAEKRAAAAADV
ncbi:MAG: AAA family ATPase, partial [Verrucomicrobiota bacterium]|nr:AAA family ATPase [Verrucomicrobiota bacterium]